MGLSRQRRGRARAVKAAKQVRVAAVQVPTGWALWRGASKVGQVRVPLCLRVRCSRECLGQMLGQMCVGKWCVACCERVVWVLSKSFESTFRYLVYDMYSYIDPELYREKK